jgi:hypothetical protein
MKHKLIWLLILFPICAWGQEWGDVVWPKSEIVFMYDHPDMPDFDIDSIAITVKGECRMQHPRIYWKKWENDVDTSPIQDNAISQWDIKWQEGRVIGTITKEQYEQSRVIDAIDLEPIIQLLCNDTTGQGEEPWNLYPDRWYADTVTVCDTVEIIGETECEVPGIEKCWCGWYHEYPDLDLDLYSGLDPCPGGCEYIIGPTIATYPAKSSYKCVRNSNIPHVDCHDSLIWNNL